MRDLKSRRLRPAARRGALAATLALLCMPDCLALQAIENFDSPPDWIVVQTGASSDVGHQTSDNAGGVAAGEAGGVVTRMAPSYAMNVGSLDPSNENLRADATMSVSGGGNSLVGWWNHSTYTGPDFHPRNFIGIYTDRVAGTQIVYLLNVANNVRTQTQITSVGDATPFLFSIAYTFNGGTGNGSLTVTINGAASQTFNLPAGRRDLYADMDRFGICGTNQGLDTILLAYIDDLSFTSDVQSTDLPPSPTPTPFPDETPPAVPLTDALDPSGTDTFVSLTLAPPFPSVTGLVIVVDSGAVATGATGSDSSFRFPSGVISSRDVWSPDNGVTWQSTPPAGYVSPAPTQDGAETAIHMGGDEIYSPSAGLSGTPPNLTIGARRSLNNWQTGSVVNSPASFVLPNAVSQIGDDGADAGYGRMQDLIHLKDGRILAATYSLYPIDQQPWDAYPYIEGQYKVRVIAMYSPLGDRGHNWGNPITIASRWMMARGGNDTANGFKSVGYMQTQEGPNEAALARTGAGNVICVMRSGHRKGASNIGMPFFDETPFYISVTEDEGQTWSIPRQVRTATETLGGGNPKMILIGNGINVLAGPDNRGAWIAFSTNGGATWNGRSYLTRSSGDIDVRRIGYNTFQAYYFDTTGPGRYVARTITVHRSGQQTSALMDFFAEGPSTILSGQSSRIAWFTRNMSDLTLSGGVFNQTPVSANLSVDTEALTETTTYTLHHAASGTTQEVTITVSEPASQTGVKDLAAWK